MTTVDPTADEYVDLPAWCRPGKRVAMFSWTGGRSRDTLSTATVVRITRTRVVVRYTVRGETVEDWVNRKPGVWPLYRSDGHGAGRRLVDPATPEVRNARAVQHTLALRDQINTAFALRSGTAPKEDRKPLADVADALALLDEINALVAPLYAQLQAQADQDGA